MRASILFAITLALLIALGMAIVVKFSGILEPRPVAQEPPPPAPPSILVAGRNIISGDVIRPEEVRLRPATPEELVEMKANQQKFLPAMIEAAIFRVATRNIEANQPILRDAVEEIGRPKPLHTRFMPYTRAVNVAVTKDNSAGGLVATGDWVDVYLTSDVLPSNEKIPSTRTTLLARNVPVIVKRDNLWKGNFPITPGPITFTLAPNLYRAALIDYARNKGALTLVPVSEAEKKVLDQQREEIGNDLKKVVALSCGEVENPQFKEEEKRVEAYVRGDATVGDDDLVRLFNLKPLTAPVAVEVFSGIDRRGLVGFNGGTPQFTASSEGVPHYLFRIPPQPVNEEKTTTQPIR